jgi:predicted DNA-binding transcriptional regulator YafY
MSGGMDALDEDKGTTARLLALLSLLQGHPRWSGPELADRLGVTVRTVRRDVERLRRLGYPVLTEAGVAGGYRLGSGGRAMPPLMLDREEAIAVAVCLRSVATDSIAGGGEAAIRALGKLEQLLPPTLRRQVGALGSMTAQLGGGGTPIDPELLVTLSRACRDSERLRVRYRDGRGRESERTLDPHRLVQTPRRWYLVARDCERESWRTFRVDRLLDVTPTGHVVALTDPPEPVAFVQSAITTAPYRYQARVELAAPIDDVRVLVPPTVGVLEPIDARRTMLTTGADDVQALVAHLARLGVDFTVHEPDELRAAVATAGRRLTEAAVRSA